MNQDEKLLNHALKNKRIHSKYPDALLWAIRTGSTAHAAAIKFGYPRRSIYAGLDAFKAYKRGVIAAAKLLRP